ncbi:hypothetical protein ATE84_0538 [Aquimarina sp. MAR_2010_214]|uniref:hypothetical protein n=1 Tax=Aquimarina sp. MAR_2010_214 TaxID=1250026 RepID=UPI000C70CC16|nr:hypothetical protein [Aquimarina sp. MAR_2010_214]PKV48538.1 hypothetical protein ATE84_0538 [Aquimarina sp. MAR_2010_214]
MRNILGFLILFLTELIFGQDLEGKWAMIIDDLTFTSIECPVIEIKDQRLITYSYDSLVGESNLEIDYKNKLFIHKDADNYIDYHFSYDQENLILTHHRLSGIDEDGNKSIINDFNYVKFATTIVNYPIDSVVKKQYDHFYGASFIRPEAKIRFYGLMCNDQVQQILGKENCPQYRLEKIDKTYFIVYYSSEEYKKWLVPIKEINEDYLLIYGIAGKKGFIKLHEIKEIKKTKTFIPN